MEASAKRKKTTKKTQDVGQQIRDAYIEHKLLEGHEPASIFKFAKVIGIIEDEFYQYYNSFNGIEKDIWHQYFVEVKSILDADPTYMEYSVREKMLAFYFTLFEQLKKNRSYVLLCFKHFKKGEVNPDFLKVFRLDFSHFMKELIQEGIETDEMVSRPYLSDNYHRGFWVQFMFLVNFWIKDESTNFESTDAAVEKAVNLSMDLVAKGPIDSIFDFAKFIIQNR